MSAQIMTAKSEEPMKFLHLALEKELVDQVDEYRFQNRCPSRVDAIKVLLRRGLPQKAATRTKAASTSSKPTTASS